ncbi:MAG: NAD(P)-dependent glycerol-3-phosphate dehydrogenase [Bacilli bacterium]|nr:NAD(P)-dependent glycerol-3-phosphate dehydrogenase [Bacilli bacterium]
MKIAILGTGAYGIALASVLKHNQHTVSMWSKFSTEIEELENTRTSSKLPNYTIPVDISFTTNMKEAILDKELIVIAVPAAFVDDVAKELNSILEPNQHLCIASKGIENDTCLFVDDVIKKYINTQNLAVISGPSFAVDIVKKIPIGLSLGTKNKDTATIIVQAFQNEYFKLRTTEDIKGIEICGAIKNVIAIASGILDGMQLPESTKAMFITESLHDIKELIYKLGGDKKTILSFAGFGDLLLTCTSPKSRNFSFGQLIGKKIPKDEIEDYKCSTTIEGLYTLKSIYQLTNDQNVDMPIIDLIYDIVENGKNPEELKHFLIEKD